MMKPRSRRLSLWLVIGLVVAAAACGTTLGAGFRVAHPSPWRAPWGDTTFVGGPVYR